MATTTTRVAETLRWLERRGTRKNREGMARYGLSSPKVFGVSVGDLQRHAKSLGRDHDLAQALWDTGWYEARMLAAFVDEPEKVTAAQMERWARDFDNWGICDTVIMHLFDRTPHAWKKVPVWCGRQGEFVRRAGLIYVPASYRPNQPAPLLILLHGGGRSSDDWETPALAALADSIGAVALAPDSRSLFTWDIVESGNYDIDLPYLNQALNRTFNQCRIDSARVVVVGFSDGASAALSLGLANGDFTRAVVAFSPGFLDDRYFRGKPRVFVSHGTTDPVLSFGATQDDIVPFLRDQDLEVEWAPFTGGHTIPPGIAAQAFDWLADGWPGGS